MRLKNRPTDLREIRPLAMPHIPLTRTRKSSWLSTLFLDPIPYGLVQLKVLSDYSATTGTIASHQV